VMDNGHPAFAGTAEHTPDGMDGGTPDIKRTAGSAGIEERHWSGRVGNRATCGLASKPEVVRARDDRSPMPTVCACRTPRPGVGAASGDGAVEVAPEPGGAVGFWWLRCRSPAMKDG